ncbi:O-antigen polysaccharide polymerase Wzy [Pseudarthrobacter oxydans]|uniref:O-antigen polysaccharide polymerase Wzy n=1 Tax=Pseudarthrobacter oxydans TaxID=1671 RepID=UPI003ECEB4E2
MITAEGAMPTRRRLFLFSGSWLAVTLILIFEITSLRLSLFQLALQLSIIAVSAVVTLGSTFARGFWSPACLFILVVSLFHAGLAPFLVFGLDPMFPRPDDYDWFYGEAGSRSLALVSLFISAFVLAASLVALSANRSLSQIKSFAEEKESAQAQLLAHIGAAFLVSGILYWVFVSWRLGGVSIFFSSYIAFLQATSGSSLSLAYMAIGLGLGLAVIGRGSNFVRFSLAMFALYAFVAFFLGLRGEVLFPLAVAASVLALRLRMPRGITVVTVLILVLSLINGAKNIRSSGLAGDPVDLSSFTPLGALAELGSSLRVVAHTVLWHEQQGDPFRGGDTYSVSFARLAESLFSPFGSPQASSDFRMMNSEVMERSGAIGGSVVAESFHNFGVLGVFVVAVLGGLVFGVFSVRGDSVASAAFYVCIAVPLFNHIRNSFVPVLPFVFISCGILFLILTFSRQRLRTHGFPRQLK